MPGELQLSWLGSLLGQNAELGIALIQEPWIYKGQVMELSSKNNKVILDTKGHP